MLEGRVIVVLVRDGVVLGASKPLGAGTAFVAVFLACLPPFAVPLSYRVPVRNCHNTSRGGCRLRRRSLGDGDEERPGRLRQLAESMLVDAARSIAGGAGELAAEGPRRRCSLKRSQTGRLEPADGQWVANGVMSCYYLTTWWAILHVGLSFARPPQPHFFVVSPQLTETTSLR